MKPIEVMYDESSHHWHNDGNYNRMFLQAQQNYANRMLHSRGHVFLNEIFDALGLPRTTNGAIVGWTNQDIPITFETHDEKDYSHPMILKFNVEGIIYDKIDYL
ncbi:MAG: DUF6353 family protein [Paenisporosarcina sp.]